MTTRRFFLNVEPVVGEDATISGQDAKHLATVVRLSPGDEIILLTGNGREYLAVIRSLSPDCVKALVVSEKPVQGNPTIELTVAVGFLKEAKMDDLIRPLTELGMCRFLPFFAGRSIARPDPRRMASRVERWEKIARESLKQCRRASSPVISPAVEFGDVISLGKANHLNLFFWEEGNRSTPLPPKPASSPLKVMVLLGPEGGLTEEEAKAARMAGFSIASLGPRILRAETAVVAAATLAQYVYGDMGERSGSIA